MYRLLFILISFFAIVLLFSPLCLSKDSDDNLRGISLGLLNKMDSIGINDTAKPVITIIAPEKTGFTSVPQPILQWHTDREWAKTIILYIKKGQTVSEITLTGPTKPGIYQTNLGHYGISLEPDIVYQWSISLCCDEDTGKPAKICYKKLDSSIIRTLQSTPADKHMAVLAANNYWYDAFYEAQDMLHKNPGNSRLLKRRNKLLSEIPFPPFFISGSL